MVGIEQKTEKHATRKKGHKGLITTLVIRTYLTFRHARWAKIHHHSWCLMAIRSCKDTGTVYYHQRSSKLAEKGEWLLLLVILYVCSYVCTCKTFLKICLSFLCMISLGQESVISTSASLHQHTTIQRWYTTAHSYVILVYGDSVNIAMKCWRYAVSSTSDLCLHLPFLDSTRLESYYNAVSVLTLKVG